MPKKPETVLGLDIDEKSVKLVELTGDTLHNYSIKEVPPAEEKDKVAIIAETIKDLLTEGKIKTTKAYSAISGPAVSIRRIAIPIIPEEELKDAVFWEAKSHVPFPIEEVTLDFKVLGKIIDKGVEKYDIMIVAAQKAALDRLTEIIETAGLKPEGLSVIPFALWDLVTGTLKPEETEVVALIDIGAEAASINIFKQNILQFTREITVAGDSLTKAMTGVLVSDQWQVSLTREQAEKIKTDYGIPPEGTTEKTAEGIPLTYILEIMKPTLRRMVNEILRSFDYFKEQYLEAKIDRVILAGGSSRLKNLENFLATELAVTVEVINPLENLNLAPELDQVTLREIAPRLTLALSLALGQAAGLDLLKVKKRAEEKKFDIASYFKGIRIPNAVLIGAAGLAIILVFSSYVGLSRMASKLKKELDSKRMVLADLEALEERRAIVRKIVEQETRIRATLNKLSAIIPNEISLSSLSYNNAARLINLSGESPDVLKVGKFLESVEKSPYFSKAVLIEARRIEATGKMSFKISFYVD